MSAESHAAVRTQGRQGNAHFAPKRIVIYLLLIGFSIVFMYPFLWLVSASFKPRGQVFDNRLIPETFTVENYVNVWHQIPLALWLMNTLIVTVLAATSVTITSAMVAWGFTYFQFPGRNLLFGLVLATMMLPGAITMIPVFLIWNQIGLVGTTVPLWAGNLFGSAFYIFLIRQFMLGLPRDLFDAARIDGANQWTLFWRIVVPLVKPALAVTVVFEIQAVWTDLMRALIYLRDASTFTIPRGLKAVVDSFGFGGEWQWEIIVTASVLATLPLIILFFVGQRQILEGISQGSMKG